jgi:hypothetical protein
MPIYRVVFANNTIVSCEEDNKSNPPSDISYEKDRQGRLVFAYIKAESLLQAVMKANELVERIVKGAS